MSMVRSPRPACDSHRSRLALIGGTLAALLSFVAAGILTQMSGCCGAAPTHGCKFIEIMDAAMDSPPFDGMPPCGLQICEPGVTACCFEPENDVPLRCIPVGGVCKGLMSASCSGDRDCPAGAGLHCCGMIDTLSIQCQAVCSGNYPVDQTARICRSDAECPPDRPHCQGDTIQMRTIFICEP
jgi:hypothetical protein